MHPINLKISCKNLSIIWGTIIIYQIISILLVIIYDPPFIKFAGFFISRIMIIVFLVIRLIVKNDFFRQYGILADNLFFYILLAYFYGETGHLNTFLFAKIDSVISNWDHLIFGFQPAVVFSEKFNNPIFSELMYFGYFSYYLIPLNAFVAFWFKKNFYFEEFSFIVISAYFIYFLIFIILPSEGPQYFFPEPLNQIEAYGPFGYIQKLIQHYGEAPTGAFPSAHIGVSVIVLILLYRNHQSLFKILLPFCILLMFSTVYIKAHYFVDVLAGLITAPLILTLNKCIFYKFKKIAYVNRD